MNLITIKGKGPVKGHDDKYNTKIIDRPWALAVNKWSVGIEQQALFDSGCTRPIRYWSVGVETRLDSLKYQGYEEIYYDGFHHVFRVGLLYFAWGE